MNTSSSQSPDKFDAYAETYQSLHSSAISASGEGTDYFHQYKVDCLKRLGLRSTDAVLDYGCGIGNLVSRLSSICHVKGYDSSKKSLEVCRGLVPNADLFEDSKKIPSASCDYVVLSCVLHHVPENQQAEVISETFRVLKQGGRVVIFEHNPWNPLTQRVVAACPFDDDAVLLSVFKQRSLLVKGGYGRVATRFIVFFPKFLSLFRALEPFLFWCPLGAQIMTVGEKRDLG